MKQLVLVLLFAFALDQVLPASADLSICPRMPSASAVSNQWISAISPAGAVTQAQPAFSNLSGSWTVSQFNSGTGASSSTFARGDGTWAAPSGATVVLAVLSSTGTFATSAGNIVKMPTTLRDTHSAYSAATGLFTVPASQGGDYKIGLNGVSTASASNLFLNINGTSIARLVALGAGGLFYGEITAVGLAAGDTIGIYSGSTFTMDYAAPSGNVTGLKPWLTIMKVN